MRWFIPDDTPRPAHIPAGGVSVRAGCAGQPGTVVGGIFSPGDWQKTAAGFWVFIDREDAADCLKLDTMPSVEVEHGGRAWLVPRLLTPSAGGWVSALPRQYGPQGWHDPYDVAPLQERLRKALIDAKNKTPQDEDELAALAGDLIGCNYHLTLTEIAHAGWLDEALAIKFFLCASRAPDDGGAD